MRHLGKEGGAIVSEVKGINNGRISVASLLPGVSYQKEIMSTMAEMG